MYKQLYQNKIMSSFDITDTIKSIINEYLLPEYPLYRVKYIDSYIDYSDIDDDNHAGTLVNRVITRIMECKQLLPNEKIRISSTGQCISPAVVKEFEKNKIVIDTYYNEHLIVIEMEKIA